MIILKWPRIIVANLCFITAAFMGGIGLVVVKLANDFVQLGLGIIPRK